MARVQLKLATVIITPFFHKTVEWILTVGNCIKGEAAIGCPSPPMGSLTVVPAVIKFITTSHTLYPLPLLV